MTSTPVHPEPTTTRASVTPAGGHRGAAAARSGHCLAGRPPSFTDTDPIARAVNVGARLEIERQRREARARTPHAECERRIERIEAELYRIEQLVDEAFWHGGSDE